MTRNQKIILGVAAGVAGVAVIALAFLLGRITGGGVTTQTTATTVTVTTTAKTSRTGATASATTTSTSTQPATSQGPYSTMNAAVNYVENQVESAGSFSAIDPGATWQPAATLHVIHATPVGGASYGGDFYFFFVDGYYVGQEVFTSGSPVPVDGATFAVSYQVYLPEDPHCCPTGGTNTVRFHWDGSQVVPLDPMPGATM